MKSKEYLEKLRKNQLEILEEIVRICSEEKIDYFLDWGTLIGAVRHKGYIPWDDDIDIGMIRKDYDRFMKIAQKKLGKRFIVCYYKTEKNHWHSFGKIRLKNTIMMEMGNKHLSMNHGIWVDIYPYDNVSRPNSLSLKIRKKIYDILTTLIAFKLNINYYRDTNDKKASIIKVFSNICCLKNLYIFRELICKLNHNSKSNYVCCFDLQKEICCKAFPKNKMFPTIKMLFEGKLYNVPNDYDYKLSLLYGDYMKIPPKKEQIMHNPLLVEFEDNECIKFNNN